MQSNIRRPETPTEKRFAEYETGKLAQRSSRTSYREEISPPVQTKSEETVDVDLQYLSSIREQLSRKAEQNGEHHIFSFA